MAKRGRPTNSEAFEFSDYWSKYHIDHQSEHWIDRQGHPIKKPVGRPAGMLTLPAVKDPRVCDFGLSIEGRIELERALKKGWKISIVWVTGLADDHFETAIEMGAPITRKAAYELAMKDILSDFGMDAHHASRLAATAIRIDQRQRQSQKTSHRTE
jgi:hypothetical protein